MNAPFEIDIDWMDAPGVVTEELAATWAGYRISIAGRRITRIVTSAGDSRSTVFGSLYPMAEWIARNWWLLTSDMRPSAVRQPYWAWSHRREQGWLVGHNLRAAGDGMPWPDLTIVPEGSVAHLVWSGDASQGVSPIRFLESGHAMISADGLAQALAEIVDQVLDRLSEKGVPAGELGRIWASVIDSNADPEEADFCRTAARLGVDPFSLAEADAEQVIEVHGRLPDDVKIDFFDSVSPGRLVEAADWLLRAQVAAEQEAVAGSNDFTELRSAIRGHDLVVEEPVGPWAAQAPWRIGYEMARVVRDVLSVGPQEPFDIEPWVGKVDAVGPSHGLQGVCVASGKRCGVALPGGGSTARPSGVRFSRARALSLALGAADDRIFLLAPIGFRNKVARAFAAELLAPAAGIDQKLRALGEPSDQALEDVAVAFGVSPLVVQLQYENQLE